MKILGATGSLAAVALVGVAAGCSGGSLATTPSPGTSAAARQLAQSHTKSWIEPDSAGGKLLYVTNFGAGTVSIFTYPGLQYVGLLRGFEQPTFDCVDKKQDVWIVDYVAGAAYEYAHGGVDQIGAITGLSEPYACAINQKTGDLAIAVNVPPSQPLGEVVIYHQGSGTPTTYSDSNFALMSGLAYDNAGNLWVDGYSQSDAFRYAELPSGASSFTDVTLSVTPDAPGAVVWDGKYVDVGDYESTIYQTQGSTVVNTITLDFSYSALRGFYVLPSGKKLIAADSYGNLVGVFRYPTGGKVKKSTTYDLNTPWDVVLSK